MDRKWMKMSHNRGMLKCDRINGLLLWNLVYRCQFGGFDIRLGSITTQYSLNNQWRWLWEL